jgi:integrase
VLLDATGLRVSELENLRWGDVDEATGRFRVSKATIKNRRSLWVDVPADLFGAVLDLTPREDRDMAGRVFPDLTQARLRTDIARACRATGTPLWSPTTSATGACRCGTWPACTPPKWPAASASANCR